MSNEPNTKLTVAISSRALFDLEESDKIFEELGFKEYLKYQLEHENDILDKGAAFSLVTKLLDLNKYDDYVEVILLSRRNTEIGLRILNSIKHHKLNISRAAFTGGSSTYRYSQAFNADLFLSTDPIDVKESLENGIAAATVLPSKPKESKSKQLKIAFDGDAVLFSDESEQIYQKQGWEAFASNEQKSASKPLSHGPFHGFLSKLHDLQSKLPKENCPIRIALITGRSAPAHERVLRTFSSWGIRIDESMFLGIQDKAEFLRAFSADIFFDDQKGICLSASQYVTAAHVPYGIKNKT